MEEYLFVFFWLYYEVVTLFTNSTILPPVTLGLMSLGQISLGLKRLGLMRLGLV